MAIVFYVSDGYGGYGDFLYGLKFVANLRRQLAERFGYTDEIYLVTQKSGKEKILNIGGDKEMRVNVVSDQEIKALRKAGKLETDYFIEGPVFNIMVDHDAYLEDQTPVLLVPEYAMAVESGGTEYLSSYQTPERTAMLMGSGFRDDEHGIIFSEDLREAARKKAAGDQSYLDAPWQKIGPDISRMLLQDKSRDDYYASTDLSFEYSHDNLSPIQSNTCFHFLRVQQLHKKDSPKNQDVFVVGKNTDSKKEALQKMLPILQRGGFGKVAYVDVETGKEEVLFDDGKSDQKVYRMLHAKQLEHPKMIAMQAISDDLCGSTGDQSFGEAFSANKLMVYECLSHKRIFADSYAVALMKTVKNPDAALLARFLIYANSEEDYAECGRLLARPELLEDIKQANLKIAENKDLLKNVTEHFATENAAYFANLVDVEANTPVNQLRKAIILGDMDAASSLVDAGVNFSQENASGISPLWLALQQQQFAIVEKMLDKAMLADDMAALKHLAHEDAAGRKVLDFMPIDLPETHPKIFSALQICFMTRSLDEIATYKPKEKTLIFANSKFGKRVEQARFFEYLKKIKPGVGDSKKNSLVIVGGLLLARKSIRSESKFFHTSSMLKKIEQELKRLNIDPNDKNLEQNAFQALKEFAEQDPQFLKENKTFVHDFNQFTGLELDRKLIVAQSPMDLSTKEIADYQKLLQKQPSGDVVKLSRKDKALASASLPFSVIKMPGDKGFYILDHGEGSILGRGGWGKVKRGYYCNENGVINPAPLAIKVQDNVGDDEKAVREVGLFAHVHGKQEDSHIYQRAPLASKQYSFMPQLPGQQLDIYLRENAATLTPEKRLAIATAAMAAMDEAHQKDVVHLDIKPGNMLYDEKTGKVFLIDFGSAEKSKQLVDSMCPGTEEYAPPEFVSRRAAYATGAMDVYSAAATVGEILGVPLSASTIPKLKAAHEQVFSEPYPAEKYQDFKFTNSYYTSQEGRAFLTSYIAKAGYDFSSLPGFDAQAREKIQAVLEKMSAANPSERPTAQQAMESLQQIHEEILGGRESEGPVADEPHPSM